MGGFRAYCMSPFIRLRALNSVAWFLLGSCTLSQPALAEYLVERHGQDTTVRRSEDGAVLFSTSVADTSEGSDTDSDMRGDEEFFHGCLWTFRQKLEICEGGSCGEAELLAHDLQRRFVALYQNRAGSTITPPLEEAAWIVLATRQENRQEMADGCPGLVVVALLFMAEVLTYSSLSGEGAPAAYAREAEAYVGALERNSPVDFATMLDIFPVQHAYEGQLLARRQADERHMLGVAAAPSVDIVVSRCNSPLQWLWEYEYPARTRMVVYEKCDSESDMAAATEFDAQTNGLVDAVASLERRFVAEPTGDHHGSKLMTGECSAYLAHIVQSMRDGSLAEFTVFVHDDGPRHIRTSLLGLVLRGLRSGAHRTVPFLHLSHERYPSFRTPCLKEVYEQAFGTELKGSLSTYCCSHFIVSRERIAARGLEFYEHLRRLVSTAPYSKARGGSCNIGRKPCYVMEFLWHHVFGEAEDLPLRAEQPTLPLALRYEGGRQSRIPSPLSVGPYMAMFRQSRYSSALEASR